MPPRSPSSGCVRGKRKLRHCKPAGEGMFRHKQNHAEDAKPRTGSGRTKYAAGAEECVESKPFCAIREKIEG